jgi:hypothetical protein
MLPILAWEQHQPTRIPVQPRARPQATRAIDRLRLTHQALRAAWQVCSLVEDAAWSQGAGKVHVSNYIECRPPTRQGSTRRGSMLHQNGQPATLAWPDRPAG